MIPYKSREINLGVIIFLKHKLPMTEIYSREYFLFSKTQLVFCLKGYDR